MPRTGSTPIPMPPAACPGCHQVQDLATGVSEPGVAPRPGDVSVCIACGTPLVFTETFALRALSLEDFALLPDALQHEIITLQLLALGRMKRGLS